MTESLNYRLIDFTKIHTEERSTKKLSLEKSDSNSQLSRSLYLQIPQTDSRSMLLSTVSSKARISLHPFSCNIDGTAVPYGRNSARIQQAQIINENRLFEPFRLFKVFIV